MFYPFTNERRSLNMNQFDDLTEQANILKFWFGEDRTNPLAVKAREKLWYSGGEEVDDEIRSRFGESFSRACDETLLHWCESADGSLALVILLDQFSRNLNRGTVHAYSQDSLSRAVAKRAINSGHDTQLTVIERIFLLHPFHHSESMLDQDFACIRLNELSNEVHNGWEKWIESTHVWFHGHRNIVKQFGRFPHRNMVLGRKSTKEEEEYLKDSSQFGQ